MKFTVENLKPEHFDEIIAQESQIYFRDLLLAHPNYKEEICLKSNGRTARLDGVIIAVCGVAKVTDYLGEAWAYFSPDILKHSKDVIKAIRQFLQNQKHIRRIHCTVDVYNTKAIRFAEAVGFKPEGILQSYGPEGHDHMMMTIIHRNLNWETK